MVRAPLAHNCPDCGTVLDGSVSIAGLCARCLLELALVESPLERAVADDPDVAPTLTYSGEGLSPGQILGSRYQIRSLLGRGGMGAVWRAFDLKLRVDVALKALHTHLLDEERALATLRQEVRTAREVVSPNVCRVFDLVELDGQELVSMEYIDGTTLAAVLAERSPLALDEAREIAAQFLVGLEAIHAAGLVHRDMKPENVMLTRSGRAVVMDFGIAKGLAEARTGTIAGTPAYMAPEQARGEAVDTRTDVFSAGVVLAEMIAPGGVRDPQSRQAVWRSVQHQPPEVAESPWQAVIRKAVSWQPEDRYPGAAALARALEEVTLRVAGAEDVTPYPGLASFTEDDAEYFFGRELEVEAMWKKLRRPHLLGLIGPSGAGKSSFIRAGLLPVMPEGWGAVIAQPGTRPFTALAQALAPRLSGDPEALTQLPRFDEPEVAVELLAGWRRRHQQALVIVDQFEELFTQNPSEVQSSFAELLSRLALEADAHVLLSMRDDFLYRCHEFPALHPMLDGLTMLSPPTGAALRRAVVQPALKCGYRFEDEALVEEILAEVEGERGALPMLAFAAARLWEHRDREAGLLTREAYEFVGGVGGALAQHAEATLERVGQERIPVVRELFRNLVTAQGTRAARDREELLSVFASPEGRVPAAEVLDALIDARLLTSFEIVGRGDLTAHSIEIIHESLLTAWPRLVRWQTQDTEGMQLRDELRQAARIWEQHDRSEDLLWSGTAFQEFQLWRERYAGGLSATEEEFAKAMTDHAQRRRRRRRTAAAAAFGLLLVVLAIVGGLWRQSEASRRQAIAEGRRAEAASLLSLAELWLEEYPTGALAYATASLELTDSPAARRLALRALWRGPIERRLPGDGWISLDFSPDGRWLAGNDCRIWPSDGGPPLVLEDCQAPRDGLFDLTGSRIAINMGPGMEDLGLWAVPSGRLLQRFALGDLSWMHSFSPAGDRLVTSASKVVDERFVAEVRSWPVTGGEPDLVARLELPEATAETYAGIDPSGSWFAWLDGRRLMLAAMDGMRPDLATARSVDHPVVLQMVAFDPSGETVATLDIGGMVRVWSLAELSARLLRTLGPIETDSVPELSMRFDVGGSRLALAEGFLWDLTGPPAAQPQRLRRAAGAIGNEKNWYGYGLAFDPRGRWVATGSRSGVAFWPLRPAHPYVIQDDGSWPIDALLTPDGTRVVLGRHDSVRVWSRADAAVPFRELYRSAGGMGDRVSRAVMSPDGSFVATGTKFGKVLILPLGEGPTRTLTGFFGVMTAIAVGPQSRRVAAEGDAVIRVWDLASGTVQILDAGDGLAIRQLAFLDSGDLLSINTRGEIAIWELTGETPRRRGVGTLPGDACKGMRPSTGKLLFSVQETGLLATYDLDTGAILELGEHGDGVRCGVLDPTGGVVVSWDRLGVLRVGSVEGGEPHLLFGHEGEINGATVSADGRWIASAADDRQVRLWPMPDITEPPLHTLPLEVLLTRLRSQTNVRAVRDPEVPAGWSLEVGPFPGWEEVPTW